MTRTLKAAVADYLRAGDQPEVELLRCWSKLRDRFVLLCGDPPPWRWILSLSAWMYSVGDRDSTFQPVAFHCDWSLETLLDPDGFLQLEYTSDHWDEIHFQYVQFTQALMQRAFQEVGPKWIQS